MESPTSTTAARGKRLFSAPAFYRAAAWLGLAALLIATVLVDDDVGVTADERAEARYGRRILDFYSSGFRDRRALTIGETQVQYGGLFDAVAGAVVHWSPFDEYVTRHFLSGLCGVLGIVAAWRIAALLAGSRAGFLAGLTLLLTPAWSGHAFFNPKDIPFGAAAAWALYAALRLALGSLPPSSWVCALFGVSAGAALGVRAGGMFMLGYPIFVLAARLWLDRSSAEPQRRVTLCTGLRLLGTLALAWCGMVIAWPWALEAPLLRPLQAADLARHFTWSGAVLFRGELIDAHTLPRSYLPTWFAITLPETYLLALVCAVPLTWFGLRKAADPKHRLAVVTLCLAAFGPLLAAIVLRPLLYDAHRHFLFLLPPMAALVGYVLSACLDLPALPKAARFALAGSFALLSLLTLRDMRALHPYEYVYFNRLVGGLKGEYQRFDTDYWGASYTEGIAWVVDHLPPPRSGAPLRVASCGGGDAVEHFLARSSLSAARFKLVENATEADVFLGTTRSGCTRAEGQVLHVVQRMGAPLLYVVRPTSPQHASR